LSSVSPAGGTKKSGSSKKEFLPLSSSRGDRFRAAGSGNGTYSYTAIKQKGALTPLTESKEETPLTACGSSSALAAAAPAPADSSSALAAAAPAPADSELPGLSSVYCSVSGSHIASSDSEYSSKVEFRRVLPREDLAKLLPMGHGGKTKPYDTQDGSEAAKKRMAVILQELSRFTNLEVVALRSALNAEADAGRLTISGVHYTHSACGWDEMDMDVVRICGDHVLIRQDHKEGH